MSSIQPIKIWGQTGANPPKIIMIVKELGLPHTIIPVSFDDVKKPDFLKINPNGRLPAIHDPNTGLTLWESGAIIEYLIEKYDANGVLSYASGTDNAYLSKQWLYFQVSGQGPYYGQAAWFQKHHSEFVQSALNRYLDEIERVTSVLDGHLRAQKERYGGEPWLVGNRITYADVAFVTYQHFIPIMLSEELKPRNLARFTEVADWIARLVSRSAINGVLHPSS
ncbi:glutathione S-transferase [Karstenula rhodostoma CBS 690.94]|uniref:Glutathione S-transferase n=1 Tax=Karstenula rhodostoma CBS 690.94 TaxID=1392251 RepID=A0A9P4PQF5_9PLEO|nr:glutathione S-transferase [Karstenula rhodostoma CBS 690.94]